MLLSTLSKVLDNNDKTDYLAGHLKVKQEHPKLGKSKITYDAFIGECDGGVPKKSDRPEHVGNDERLEHVQLEVAVRTSDSDGDVVAHHLSGNHGYGFALGGVDLTCKKGNDIDGGFSRNTIGRALSFILSTNLH